MIGGRIRLRNPSCSLFDGEEDKLDESGLPISETFPVKILQIWDRDSAMEIYVVFTQSEFKEFADKMRELTAAKV